MANKNSNKKSVFRKILNAVLCVILVLLIVVGSYAAYVFIDYDRIDDNLALEISDGTKAQAKTNEEIKVLAYNIGFCAYTPDFSFFMDGGEESRAKSKESVIDVTNGIIELLKNEDADIVFMEEVDKNSDRSHHVDEQDMISKAFKDYDSTFAVNFDSAYLFYPVTKPHGKSLSGLLTMSRFDMENSIRRSLPVEESVMKIVDLDRCYSVTRIKTDNSKELVLYTVHLSAYTSDGTVTTKQLDMLINDMKAERDKGNYIICGGDFNKDILIDSSKYFGVSGEEYTWAQPFPESKLENTGLSLVKPIDENAPVATCRNTDKPAFDGMYTVTLDGFIVSDNIEVKTANAIDTEFKYSDHNPVYMTVVLK